MIFFKIQNIILKLTKKQLNELKTILNNDKSELQRF